jgi:hypothetical protein
MTQAMSKRVRIVALGVAAGALLVGSPMIPAASAQAAHVPAAAGSTYGGTTSQGLPVIADVTANGRQLVRVLAAVRATCTPSNTAYISPVWFRRVTVSKRGRFAASFGPEIQRNADGTTSDYTGRVTGRFNKARTQLSGTWRLTSVDHDTAGAVTDTCDSTVVTWRAKQ